MAKTNRNTSNPPEGEPPCRVPGRRLPHPAAVHENCETNRRPGNSDRLNNCAALRLSAAGSPFPAALHQDEKLRNEPKIQ